MIIKSKQSGLTLNSAQTSAEVGYLAGDPRCPFHLQVHNHTLRVQNSPMRRDCLDRWNSTPNAVRVHLINKMLQSSPTPQQRALT